MHEASKYGSENHLTLIYRGVTIRMEADDPRLPFIELLIFGQTLPPPHPLPPVEDAAVPEPVVEEVAPPVVEVPELQVPDAWVTLWRALPAKHRRLLLTLSDEPLTAPAIEARLRLKAGALRGLSILISYRAKDARMPTPIQKIGQGRQRRRYFVEREARRWMLELERRWANIDAGSNGG